MKKIILSICTAAMFGIGTAQAQQQDSTSTQYKTEEKQDEVSDDVEDAADDASDNMQQTGDEIERDAEKAGNEVEQEMDQAGDKVEEGAEEAGDKVEEGQDVIILESMKMEIPITAEVSGTVKEVKVNIGDFVNEGDVLLVLV